MDSQYSRRQALKLLGGAALATVPGLRLIDEASAGRTWCRRDPLFNIGGYLFDLTVGSDVAMLTEATGPVEVTLHIPRNMTAELVYDDDGFGYGYRYDVRPELRAASNSTFQVKVGVVCPAQSRLPVSILLTSVDRTALDVDSREVFGVANKPVRWAGRIDKVAPDDARDLIEDSLR